MTNLLPLRLDSRLQTALNKLSGEKKQLLATYVLRLLVEHCKNELSTEAYAELLERYSKTIEQQVAEKKLKEQKRLEREKLNDSFRERELALKEKNAQAYEDISKLPIREKIDRLLAIKHQFERSLKVNSNPQYQQVAEKKLKEIDEKLKALGYSEPQQTEPNAPQPNESEPKEG